MNNSNSYKHKHPSKCNCTGSTLMDLAWIINYVDLSFFAASNEILAMCVTGKSNWLPLFSLWAFEYNTIQDGV